MSEKYTVDANHFEGSYTIHKDNNSYFAESLVSSNAELVCRLLNEEEKRKSLPKINNIHKNEIIIFLINCAEIQNSIKYLHSAKIIDALEASDDK